VWWKILDASTFLQKSDELNSDRGEEMARLRGRKGVLGGAGNIS